MFNLASSSRGMQSCTSLFPIVQSIYLTAVYWNAVFVIEVHSLIVETMVHISSLRLQPGNGSVQNQFANILSTIAKCMSISWYFLSTMSWWRLLIDLCRETSLAAVLASHSSMEICWCGAHQLAQGDHITNVLGSHGLWLEVLCLCSTL
jgi:hypothetical protein